MNHAACRVSVARRNAEAFIEGFHRGIEPRGVIKVPYELTDTDYAWVKHHLDLAGQRCIRNEDELVPPSGPAGASLPPDHSWLEFEKIRR